MSEREIQTELPLTEPTLFILLSLAPEPKHGYAIMKEVEALSNGRVKLSTGTLYGAIKRLLENGWIQRVGEAEAPETGRERKAYELTEYGRGVMEAEIGRLQALVQTASRRAFGEGS